MTLFERIKFLADKQGKSINDVENDLNYSQNTLYRLKRTNPSAKKLEELADYFQVSTDYLLGRQDEFELAELKAEKQRKSENEFGQAIDTEKEFLQTFVADIVDLDKFDTLDYLYEVAKREKENIIREEKLETLISNPKISNKKLNEIDPFEKVHKQNAELSKKGLLPYRNNNTQPDTLAAHQVDPSHIIDDNEANEIAKFLDDQIDRHEKK